MLIERLYLSLHNEDARAAAAAYGTAAWSRQVRVGRALSRLEIRSLRRRNGGDVVELPLFHSDGGL